MFRTEKNRTAPCENLIANYSIQLALMWLNCILILNRSVQCNGWIRFDLIMSRWYRARLHILHTYNMNLYFHYCFIIQLSELRFTSLHIAVQCYFSRCASIQIQLMRLFRVWSIYTAQVQMYHFETICSQNVEFCWFQEEKTVGFYFLFSEKAFSRQEIVCRNEKNGQFFA